MDLPPSSGKITAPNCWGWEQGIYALQDLVTYFNSDRTAMSSTFVAFDIEGDNVDGWVGGNGGNDRLTFNGFYDYMSGASSSCGASNGTEHFQPEVYASPATWFYEMSGQTSIPNTPVWTPDPYCYQTAQPQSMAPAQNFATGGSGTWPSYSNYLENWQFWATTCSPSADWDTAASSQYMPIFGTYMY
jgi:hypothetical protein